MQLSTTTSLALVDSRNANASILLPLTTGIYGRSITIKDAYGVAQASSISVLAQGSDYFETGGQGYAITNNYGFRTFVAGSNKWFVTNTSVLMPSSFMEFSSATGDSLFARQVVGFSTLTTMSSLQIRDQVSTDYIPLISSNGSLYFNGSVVGGGGVSEAGLVSSLEGLGTLGYLSTGGGGGGISELQLVSTVEGLGTLNYVSSLSSMQVSSIQSTDPTLPIYFNSDLYVFSTVCTHSLVVYGLSTVNIQGQLFTASLNVIDSASGTYQALSLSNGQIQINNEVQSTTVTDTIIVSTLITGSTIVYSDLINNTLISSFASNGSLFFNNSQIIQTETLHSSIEGLGNFYLSTGGGGGGGISTDNLVSSIEGLGNFYLSTGGGGGGGISSNDLTSTTTGLTDFVSSFYTDSNHLASTTTGLTSFVSSFYTDSNQLASTTNGLTTFVSSFYVDFPELTSTTSGLGGLGYLSTTATGLTVSTYQVNVFGGASTNTTALTLDPNFLSGYAGISSVFTSSVTGIVYGCNMFVAVGQGTRDTLAWSPNGVNWIGLGCNILRNPNSILFGGGNFLATGRTEWAWSSNGLRWVVGSNGYQKKFPIPYRSSGANVATDFLGCNIFVGNNNGLWWSKDGGDTFSTINLCNIGFPGSPGARYLATSGDGRTIMFGNNNQINWGIFSNNQWNFTTQSTINNNWYGMCMNSNGNLAAALPAGGNPLWLYFNNSSAGQWSTTTIPIQTNAGNAPNCSSDFSTLLLTTQGGSMWLACNVGGQYWFSTSIGVAAPSGGVATLNSNGSLVYFANGSGGGTLWRLSNTGGGAYTSTNLGSTGGAGALYTSCDPTGRFLVAGGNGSFIYSDNFGVPLNTRQLVRDISSLSNISMRQVSMDGYGNFVMGTAELLTAQTNAIANAYKFGLNFVSTTNLYKPEFINNNYFIPTDVNQTMTLLYSSTLSNPNFIPIKGTSTMLSSMNDIAFDGSNYIGVGRPAISTAIIISSNLIDWTAISTIPLNTGALTGIAFGNSTLVAVGGSTNTVLYSNATTNNEFVGLSTTVFNRFGIDVFFANNRFVAVGQNSTIAGNRGFVGSIVTSPDGISWTSTTSTSFNLAANAFATAPITFTGVNCNAPRYTLDVNGGMNAFVGFFSNGIFTTSDSNVKTDIQPANLDICYSTIRNLPLRRFGFISEYSQTKIDKVQTGFLAQELGTYFPKSVYTNIDPNSQMLTESINYDQIFLTHYGATQRLISTVETLQIENAEMKLAITDLQQKVSSLIGAQ